jgi:CelD/BcsL family acetyltransferase involved in cellulose biosynthesis
MINALDSQPINLLASSRPLSAAAKPVQDVTGLRFEVVQSTTAIDALSTDWNELFAHAGRPTQVFQTHAFSALWARIYSSDAKTASLAIIIARQAGRLVMVWPLVVERSLGLKVVSWLGAPIAQYGDVLIAPSETTSASGVISQAWDYIQNTLRPDVLRLRKVRSDAAITPFLARIGAIELLRQEAPAVTLKATGTQSFEDRQSAKARKNRRRLLRRLEEQGTVTFQTAAGNAQAAGLAVAALDIKRRWLTERGLHSQAFAGDRLDRFFKAAAADPDSPTGCTVFTLSLDGRPLSALMGFACGNRMTLHVIGYDLDFERSGAGVLGLEATLRHCEQAGMTAVDLLAPRADYKLDWADETVDVVDHALPVTLKGRAYVSMYDQGLRPAAKSTLEKLPLALRKTLTRLVRARTT